MNQRAYSFKREVKENLSLSMPLMAAWIIYSLGPFAGTAMVAHLGKDVLAASVLVGTIWWAGVTFCFGLFNSVSVLVAQQRGANDYEAISKIMGQAFLLNVISWVPIIILLLLTPYFVHWSSANSSILSYVTSYAHSLILVAPGLITLAILENFLNGIGKTQLSLWISLIEIPIEIFFIYIFVFGKLGLPAFGIAGVGYGLALSFTLTTIALFIYLNYAKFSKPFRIFTHINKIHLSYCKEILNIGMPIGFTYFIELVAFTIITYFISQFQATALASHQIVLQFESVFINVPYSISQAVSIRVGLSVGRQDKIGVWYASYVGIAITVFAAIGILAVLILFPDYLLAIDLDPQKLQNNDIINLTKSLFLILGVYQFFDSIRVLQAGALRGLKDTKSTLIVNIICFLFIGVCASYFLGVIINGNVQGIWWGLTLGMALVAIVLYFRLVQILKRMDLTKILKIT